MKKTYSKPVLYFESFKISSSIASTCTEHVASSADVNSCSYSWNGINLFINDDQCMPGMYDENGTCYHGPLAINNIFGS